MSLQVWLPLNKNVIENKGLSDVTITNNGATFVNSGIESCYQIDGEQITFPTTNLQFMEMKHGKSFSCSFWVNGVDVDSWLFACTAWEVKFRTTLIAVYPGGAQDPYASTQYAATINNNQWYHIAFTWDGNTNDKLTLYINGNKKDESIFSRDFSLASTFKMVYSGTRKISDFRIYDHALSDKEVYELAKGLMFHLKLDNTDLYDCSGYGWSVTKYSSGTLSENADSARYSKSLKFDGNVAISNQANLNNSETVTVTCWAKPNSANLNHLFGFNCPLSSDNAYWQFILAGSCLGVRDNLNGATGTRIDYPIGNVEANKWIHLVCSYNKGTVKIYKNGIIYSTNSTGGSKLNDNITVNFVGASYQVGFFDGSISDFRIYRTALTDEQVAELYKVGGSIDNHGNAHCYELNEKPAYDDRLRFESVGNSTIGLKVKSSYQTIEYSKNYSTWITMDTTTTISLTDKEVVYLRGILSADNTGYSNYTNFEMTGSIKGYGNLNYLWNYQDLNAPLKKYCGHQLFISCNSLLLPPDLPATELADGCYQHMLQSCENLLALPELPAKTLKPSCYQSMFWRAGTATPTFNYLKCLATSGIGENNSTSSWFGNGIASTGTFIKDANATWPIGAGGIPSGWTIKNA